MFKQLDIKMQWFSKLDDAQDYAGTLADKGYEDIKVFDKDIENGSGYTVVGSREEV